MTMAEAQAFVEVLSENPDGSTWEIVDRSNNTSAEVIPPHHLNGEWTLQFASRPNDCILLRRRYATEVTYRLLRHRINTSGGEHVLLEDDGSSQQGRKFDKHSGRLHFNDVPEQYWIEPHWWKFCQCITENWLWPLYLNKSISEFMGPSTSQEFRGMLEKAPFGDVMAYLHCFNNYRNFEESAEIVSQVADALNQQLAPLLEKQDGNPLSEMMTDRGIVRGVGNRIGWRLRKFWDSCSELLPDQLIELKQPLEFNEPK